MWPFYFYNIWAAISLPSLCLCLLPLPPCLPLNIPSPCLPNPDYLMSIEPGCELSVRGWRDASERGLKVMLHDWQQLLVSWSLLCFLEKVRCQWSVCTPPSVLTHARVPVHRRAVDRAYGLAGTTLIGDRRYLSFSSSKRGAAWQEEGCKLINIATNVSWNYTTVGSALYATTKCFVSQLWISVRRQESFFFLVQITDKNTHNESGLVVTACQKR